LLKKSLAVGIIFLFLLSSLIPITSSYSSYETNKAHTVHINENGTLSGYVTDSAINPLEGARVRVYFHETYEENYTDSTGYYNVTNIPICWCLKNATASKDGYTTEWVLLAIDENTTHDFVLMPLGKTLYVGGSGAGNYSKIQDAIDNANDGDTVFVYNGVYYTTHFTGIIINKKINIIGENRCSTIIDGKMEHLFVVCICSEYVNISGFTIRNGDSPDEDFRYGAGIDVDGGIGHINISDNIISNNAYGIFLSQFNDNIIISSNKIIQNRNSGILLSGSNNKVIDNNIIHNHEHGIFLIGSDNTILSRNTIKDNNQVGLKLLYDIDFLKNCRDNTVYQNNFINNKIEATITKTFKDSRIAKNILIENFWDIPRVKPKLIFGSYVIMILVIRIPIIPIVEVDWHPAKEPYDIP